MNRVFFLPLILGGTRGKRWPKYFPNSGLGWSLLDYGSNDFAILTAENPESDLIAQIEKSDDAIAFPEDLDSALGIDLYSLLTGKLEVINIPMDRFSRLTQARAIPAFLMQQFKYGCAKQAQYGDAALGVPLDMQAKLTELSKDEQERLAGTGEKLEIDPAVFAKGASVREILNTIPMVLPTDDLQLLNEPFSADARIEPTLSVRSSMVKSMAAK